MDIRSCEIKVTGIVQGVGFRPFVYNLAKSLSLNGWVNNFGASVVIQVEGSSQAIEMFIEKLKSEAPPLSLIKEVTITQKICSGYTDFTIKESSASEGQSVYISPDVSICPDCIRELLDPKDRRYLYPFINCTNCGPRFTIIQGVPYDRINTTMNKFPMCEKCASEYNHPADRRYHAQPVSCYDCGPKLEVIDHYGTKIQVPDPIQYIRKKLSGGKTIAVKGLGGYHLVCDALNGDAVRQLRKRKVRDDKPFAVMVKNSVHAGKYCYISEAEKKLLESERKPIVLLKKREEIDMPQEIAPGNPYLGIMLPYTPVHLLLFEPCLEDGAHTRREAIPMEALVMTSGNRSSEPIYYKDDEAFENLRDIADYFLINDRDIFIRTDDSVSRVFKGKEYMIRRSRGYVPMPVAFDTGMEDTPSVLACGGELKNTFCMNKGNEFYLSHHIGDLENAETLLSFEEGIEHFKRMFRIQVDAVAYDLHPEYLSTKYAMELDTHKKIAVQHHHAHIASVMAENNLHEDVIGVAFDGTGYGEDGQLWGGEFFTGNFKAFKRVGHLEYVRMPGGEAAVKEPWRMALSYLTEVFPEFPAGLNEVKGIKIAGIKVLDDIECGRISAVYQVLEKKVNTPLTSSMGRLFDAVSALIGVRNNINYEGQAAIELEYIASRDYYGKYNYTMMDENGVYKICVHDVFRGIIDDIKSGVDKPVISSKFHETIADMVIHVCQYLRTDSGLEKVALSGGVFQNITLLDKCVNGLREKEFEVYIHSRIPSNDGGISLGQAVIAAARIRDL